LPSLKALFEFDNSVYHILSPQIGYYFLTPKKGALLKGGDFIGKIKVLNSIYNLYLPENVYGKVEMNQEMDKLFNVEYKQLLFCLNPEIMKTETKDKSVVTAVEEEIEKEDGFVVTAFSNGVFYRQSSPDSPPYVKEGQKIEKGKTLGLIEVMKVFIPIDFQGTDTSDSGIVKKILVKDASEVKSGQPLFLIS